MAKKTVKPAKSITAGVRLDVRPDTPSYYVNYVAVTHTPYDFCIGVARIPSQLTSEQAELAKKGEPVPIEATLQLIIPSQLIDGLIKALADQKQKYEENLAKVKKNEPDQQHVGPLGPVH
jgi:hypothetical protein